MTSEDFKVNDNIFGCFLKVGFDPDLRGQDFVDLANVFRPYIWGDKGIDKALKRLKYADYGKDLKLALFQFYVRPTPVESRRLKEIESYRKNEKAIGIPIIVTDENFFSKSEKERYDFMKDSILQKMDLLEKVVKQKKLDTKMEQLKSDLQKELL
jgi:hypothetical protein